jgi:hypothetical protein
MPRPVTWLPRLRDIRESVKHSVRSHYDRAEIERLFQLQPRAAQQLMKTVGIAATIGNSRVVERGALQTLLDALFESEDPAGALAKRKAAPPPPMPRRAIRSLMLVDRPPATLNSLPHNLSLETGKLTITFEDVQELAGTLGALAVVLDKQSEQFAERYEVPLPTEPRTQDEAQAQLDIERMYRELAELERNAKNHQ